MKKLFAVLLVFALLLSLCSCGGVKLVETEAEDLAGGALPELGNIYLETDGREPWEYTRASIRADWTGAEMPKQHVQIKLRGNSSTQSPKKSYNIKFSEKMRFMGLGEGKKWSLLASPYDKSLLRISLAFDYAENIGLPYVPDSRLCKLWLDGKYMGIYTVMEPIGDGKDRIDIDVKEGDAIFECDADRWEEGVMYIHPQNLNLRFQINEPETMTDLQAALYADKLDQIYTAVRTMDHTVYEEYIDIDSFVNFYIFQELVKDIDFNRFSTRYFLKNGKLYAGPPWDLDLSMGNVSRVVNEIGYHRYHNKRGFGSESEKSTDALWAQTGYYEWLCQDEYFRDLVRARWQELKPITENLVIDNEEGRNQIDRYLEMYGEELQNNYGPETTGWAVWLQDGTYADQSVAVDYEGNVEELRTWLTERIAWLDTQFGVPAE
ncbi:MAG: CotH kinase family protein [Clostridia bacterium]|nr:CotH kinase family protein [Clostridia bacterium]